MRKKNILYISPTIPCPSIPHAGGQLAFYYLNKLNDRKDVCLKVINLPSEKESVYFTEASQIFDLTCCYHKNYGIVGKILAKLNGNTFGFIPLDAYKLFKNKIKQLNTAGYKPDYVLFDWEEMAYLYKVVHAIWPTAVYSVIEQDVLYQSLSRYLSLEKNIVKKIKYYFSFIRCIRAEKVIFPNLNEIVVLSEKDRILVKSINPLLRTRVISPYYHNYNTERSYSVTNEVIFYGSLSRQENYEAVEWFIKNVMPCIKENIKFIIIGGGCPENIKQLATDNIIFTGFLSIEEISKIFSRALCMVVPLFHGAGVKIKVLEAMSAGLPVLTNSIGIEGISGRQGIEYIHCEQSVDYVQNISILSKNSVLRDRISKSSKDMIGKSFNYHECHYIEL